MTRADDLERGMFIAVTGFEEEPREPEWDNPFFIMGRQRRRSYDGVPLEIVAISLPFVCVTDGQRHFSIDIRTCRVQRLQREYVKAMQSREVKPLATRRRRRKEKPDPMRCPRCNSRRVQRLIKPGAGEWAPYCKNCGFTGEPPQPSP